MSDSYSFTRNKSYGDNIVESIKGMLVGIVLFVVAFPLLWWNEGRTDMGNVAKKAQVVAPQPASATGEGKLVAVTGPLATEDQLSDPKYLQPGAYVKLQRDVEQYAWVETKKTKEEKKLGGGSKETTTYTYDLKWTSSPRSSEDFAVPEGHENPPLAIERDSWRAESAKVGVYSFDPSAIELPSANALSFKGKLKPGAPRTDGDYLYVGKGNLQQPKLGDVRISFRAVEAGRTVTAYGQKQGATLVAYMHEGKDKLFRVVDGTHEQAIATLKAEHRTTTWILRLVGFLFIWFGMALVLGPIQAVLDVIPFVGSTSRALTGIALLPIALVLASLTIVTSLVAHNPILLGGVVVLFLAGMGFLIKRGVDKKKAAQSGSTIARAA
jgi:hypothetical protein